MKSSQVLKKQTKPRSSDLDLIYFYGKEALRKRIEKAKRKVKIRDIIAYPFNQNSTQYIPMGEFYKTHVTAPKFNATLIALETEPQFINRILQHLQDLADIAAKIHIKDNFIDPSSYILPRQLHEQTIQRAPFNNLLYQLERQRRLEEITLELKVDKLNDITRLSTSEFTFYPAKERGPLSLTGFKNLLIDLEKIAEVYPINFHILFATIPVILTPRKICNVAIYIQCGRNPTLQPFVKTLTSHVDPIYPNMFKYFYTDSWSYAKFKNMTIPSFIVDIDSESQNVMQSGNVICQTAGHAKFRVSMEICLDNYVKTTKKLIQQELTLAKKIGDGFQPIQVSQLITSNVIHLTHESLISNTIIHNDPVLSPHFNSSIFVYNQTIAYEHLIKHFDPSFGSSTMIQVFPVIAAGQYKYKFKEDLKTEILSHNEMIIKLNALRLCRSQRLHKIEEIDVKINQLILEPIKKLKAKGLLKKISNIINDRKALIIMLNEFLYSNKLGLEAGRIISVSVSLLKQEQRLTESFKNLTYSLFHISNISQALPYSFSSTISLSDTKKALVLPKFDRLGEKINAFPLSSSKKTFHIVMDKKIERDLETGQKVFTFRAYDNEKIEVSSLRLYAHPFLCRSQARDRHNVISVRGPYAERFYDEIEIDKIKDICVALPSTPWEKIQLTAIESGLHGASRGVGNVMGEALNICGVSKTTSKIASEMTYYGLFFSSRVAMQTHKESNFQSLETVVFQSLYETACLAVVNNLLDVGSKILDYAANQLRQTRFAAPPRILNKFSKWLPYTSIFYQGISGDTVSTLTSLASSTAAQTAVESIGHFVINKK